MRKLEEICADLQTVESKLLSLSAKPPNERASIPQLMRDLDRLQREIDYTVTELRFAAVNGSYWAKQLQPKRKCSCGGG